jgi:hypothetical protein
MTAIASPTGHVYVLTSPHSPFIKIGGTAHAPLKRIREINACEPYKSMGPWSLHDFRQVTDWRNVEYRLHYALRSKLVSSIPGQKELFAAAASDVSAYLAGLDTSLIVKKPQIDRLFQETELADFLEKLFSTAALLKWLDLQGGWTFSLFPATSGGRYYTLNIGRHEVAFSAIANKERPLTHMIYMDQLVQDFREPYAWLLEHGGTFSDGHYASAKSHATSVMFSSSFDEAAEFLGLPGVRRAILAYWNESLVEMQERGSLSVFARYHHWNAVAELHRRIHGTSEKR